MNYLKIIFLVLFAMFWQVKSLTEHLSKNFARFHCYKLLHCVPGGVSLCTKDIAYRGDRYVDLIRFPDKCSFYSANCRQLGHFWVVEEDKCHGWMPYNEQWYLDRYTKEPTEPTEAKEQNTPRSDEDTEPVTPVSDTTVTTASSKDTEPVTPVTATTVTTATSKDTEPVTPVTATTVTTASSKDTEPVTTVSATTVTTASSKDTEPVTPVSNTEGLRTPSDKDAIERARFLRHILKNMNFGLVNLN